MKKTKKNFLKSGDSINYKPNTTTFSEMYFDEMVIDNDEFSLCIECYPPNLPEKITVILIYIDVSELANKKSINPLTINEYYIKETLEIKSSNIKSLKEGVLKTSKKIGNKKLWKIKFEIKSKHKHHIGVFVMDKNYKTI